jgi:hypothetical protein
VSADENSDDHPADVVNLSLIRAKGILSSLASLFDDRRAKYAVDVPYVAQSVKAMTGLLNEASDALNDLYQNCDLSLRVDDGVDASTDMPTPQPGEETALATLRNRAAAFTAVEAGEDAAESASPSTNDAPASSYEELLQKVTAAEVFANAQARMIAGGESSMLLPILNSLKQDLLRMKQAG